VRTALDRRSVLKNTILAEHFDGCTRLEEQIGPAGEHKGRGRTFSPYDIPLEQGRIAVHYCSVDLRLTAGHNEASI
jgi:hypothetical protein